MLGFMCGDFQVGIYSAAVKIRTVLTTLITSVGTVLLPRLSFYIAGENWKEFKRLLKKSYCTIIMIAVPVMVYFILVAKPSVVFLSGAEYEEFLLTKRLYEQTTGRSQKSDVIAYQVRQSFKPGEVTPEEANRIVYEFAERFLKGKHAFIVATSTDRIFSLSAEVALKERLVQNGDTVVITAGVPLGKSGSTNLIKAQVIDEDAL